MNMNILRSLKLRLHTFRIGENGNVPLEGLMAFIFLSWWYIMSFQFFDAYRQKNINLKAAYTVADLLSRETGPTPTDPTSAPVNQAYINGINTVFDYLTNSNRATWVRVSSVYWDDDAQKYRVDWSATSGTGHQIMTTTKLQGYKSKIPVLPTGETIVLVETFMYYEPFFQFGQLTANEKNNAASIVTPYETGLESQWFTTFIPTSPRFASCLPWQTTGCGVAADGNWVNPDLDPPVDEGIPDP